MESQVKSFQRNEGLVANGIVDSVTLNKLYQAYETNRRIVTYTDYDLTLTQALDIQMNITDPPPQTDLYRNQPGYVSGSYVQEIRLGKIYDHARVNIRTAPNLSAASRKETVDPGTSLIVLGTVKGDTFSGSTDWYRIEYKGDQLYVHSAVVNITGSAHRTTANLNVRSAPSISSHIYGRISNGSNVNVLKKRNDNWYEISFGGWRNATRADTLWQLDPANNSEYQHLDLSFHMGLSASELNKFLVGKGILTGEGAAFAEASRRHNVNELYLISHALLETGHGSSTLAKGVVVNGVRVYNMFGVNAFDSCAINCGSQKAFDEGWDTPSKAIIGGAKFLGERYIHNENQQNTLYKMRWNPTHMSNHGVFGRQYATDIGWAQKQTGSLNNMLSQIEDPRLRFDFVRYK